MKYGIAITVAAAALLAGPALAQGKKINIGYATATDFLPAYIAKETGCFERSGLDATMTRVPIASNIPAAIASGSMQIGMSTATIVLQAAEGGLGLVVVAGATRMVKANPTLSLVVRNGLDVKTAQDLKGKKVGVPGISSVGDVMFRQWLKESGMQPGDVTIVEAPFPQMNDMLKSGTVDGVTAAEPIRSMIVGAGNGYRSPVEYYTAVNPDSILAFWTADGAWAAAMVMGSGAGAAFTTATGVAV